MGPGRVGGGSTTWWSSSRSTTGRFRRRSTTAASPRRSAPPVNHVVCHGIPNAKPLREGDIVNIDVTLIVDGWHGDTSRMFAVGTISRRAERLIEVTYGR